jgi:FkbM family methyltransferase
LDNRKAAPLHFPVARPTANLAPARASHASDFRRMSAPTQRQGVPARTVEFRGARMAFATPTPATAWRVDTLLTKEPDTIEWIGGFGPADVLVDIGANVGMYTVFAAKTRGVRVFAFEPESQNYAVLNQNIFLNGVDQLVQAYCIALCDRTGVDRLYLSEVDAGGSCHSYGAPLDFNNRPRAAPFAQGCYATTLDALVGANLIPAPTHIKIDVDGLEHSVVAGARETLRGRNVQSVLIEVNTNLDEHWDIVDVMVAEGFNYSQAQVERAQRSEGAFKGVGNYVFRR